MNDKALKVALFGSLSTISAEIITRILVFAGIGKFSVYQMDSLFITNEIPDPFLGFIITSAIGGLVAILFCFSLEKLGHNYLVTKCVMASILAWVVLESLSTVFLEGRFIGPRPLSDYYNHLVGDITYGIMLGILLKRFVFGVHSKRAAEFP